MADDAARKASEAYDDALEIYSNAESITMPSVNVDLMKDDAADIKDEAMQIQEEADRLLDQHRDLMEDVNIQKRDAEDMLDNGIRQQQVIKIGYSFWLKIYLYQETTLTLEIEIRSTHARRNSHHHNAISWDPKKAVLKVLTCVFWHFKEIHFRVPICCCCLGWVLQL